MAFEECKLHKQREVVLNDFRVFSRNDGTRRSCSIFGQNLAGK